MAFASTTSSPSIVKDMTKTMSRRVGCSLAVTEILMLYDVSSLYIMSNISFIIIFLSFFTDELINKSDSISSHSFNCRLSISSTDCGKFPPILFENLDFNVSKSERILMNFAFFTSLNFDSNNCF